MAEEEIGKLEKPRIEEIPSARKSRAVRPGLLHFTAFVFVFAFPFINSPLLHIRFVLTPYYLLASRNSRRLCRSGVNFSRLRIVVLISVAWLCRLFLLYLKLGFTVACSFTCRLLLLSLAALSSAFESYKVDFSCYILQLALLESLAKIYRLPRLPPSYFSPAWVPGYCDCGTT